MTEMLLNLFEPADRENVKHFLEMPHPGATPLRPTLIIKGYVITQGFSAEMIEYIADHMKYNSGDVIVASYTKTGTQWIMEIVRRMLYQSKEEEKISNQLPFSLRSLELGASAKKFELLDKLPLKRRLMSTHLPAGLMDVEKIKKANAKVIYSLRNPKDQMVSFYHFFGKSRLAMKEMFHSGWDHYFNEVITGNFGIHTKPGEWYPDNILPWYKHRDGKTVQFVYYEDMVKDTFKEVRDLAKFLEISISDEKIKEIIDQCSMKNMKKNSETVENEGMKNFLKINIRKGGVGGWKDHFTVSQSERIDAIMEEKLKDTGIKFTYEL